MKSEPPLRARHGPRTQASLFAAGGFGESSPNRTGQLMLQPMRRMGSLVPLSLGLVWWAEVAVAQGGGAPPGAPPPSAGAPAPHPNGPSPQPNPPQSDTGYGQPGYPQGEQRYSQGQPGYPEGQQGYPQSQQGYPQGQTYPAQGSAGDPRYGQAPPAYAGAPPYEPPPPPPPRDASPGSGIPDWSVRLDPFNWLIAGRLGLELEVAVWEFVSVELVPVFVTGSEPPAFNFSGREDTLSQHSNGLGALSGAALDAGFWLGGKPFRGYVLRVGFTNYGYTYEGNFPPGHDEVSHTERRFFVMIGSQARFGFFTIAGGLGLEYELNNQRRCFVDNAPTEDCSDDGLEVAIAEEPAGYTRVDLNGPLHPVYLAGRISLGVVF